MKNYAVKTLWTLAAFLLWSCLATTFVAVMLGHNGVAGKGVAFEFAASAFHLGIALGVYWPLCKTAWHRTGKSRQV